MNIDRYVHNYYNIPSPIQYLLDMSIKTISSDRNVKFLVKTMNINASYTRNMNSIVV